jgi:hypothetical protein
MKRIVALVSLLLALGVLTAARAIADNGMSLSLAPTLFICENASAGPQGIKLSH